MKILAVSDLHNDAAQVRKLAERAEKDGVKVVVICGDITFFDDYEDGMIGPFLKKGMQVLMVPGNHDSEATIDFMLKKYSMRNIHGDSALLDSVGIFGAGWATNVGPVMISEKEMRNCLRKGFEDVKEQKVKIMVTHVHPKGGAVEREYGYPGSSSVTKMIYELKPDLHLHGHIHEAEGNEDLLGNTISLAVGKHGKIIEIE